MEESGGRDAESSGEAGEDRRECPGRTGCGGRRLATVARHGVGVHDLQAPFYQSTFGQRLRSHLLSRLPLAVVLRALAPLSHLPASRHSDAVVLSHALLQVTEPVGPIRVTLSIARRRGGASGARSRQRRRAGRQASCGCQTSHFRAVAFADDHSR